MLLRMYLRWGERHRFKTDVVDSTEGDSARGDYAGPMPGVVRPLLHWETTRGPAKRAAPGVEAQDG